MNKCCSAIRIVRKRTRGLGRNRATRATGGYRIELERVAFIARNALFFFPSFIRRLAARKGRFSRRRVPFTRSFQVYVFSHRDIMYVSASPSYATFTPKCQLLFHFSVSPSHFLPAAPGTDQSDYAQQRDDCCKAIYDFSLYLFQVADTTAAIRGATRDRRQSGGGERDPPTGKGETLETEPACVSCAIYIDILIM